MDCEIFDRHWRNVHLCGSLWFIYIWTVPTQIAWLGRKTGWRSAIFKCYRTKKHYCAQATSRDQTQKRRDVHNASPRALWRHFQLMEENGSTVRLMKSYGFICFLGHKRNIDQNTMFRQVGAQRTFLPRVPLWWLASLLYGATNTTSRSPSTKAKWNRGFRRHWKQSSTFAINRW